MPSEPPPYAELHCRSNFTFLRGASLPEELVARAAEKRYSSLALTDEASLSGVVRAHVEARERGLHFIVGSELQLMTTGGRPFARLVFLAQDRRGYGNLSELITLARRRAAKGSYVAHVADVEGKTAKAPHLAGMAGCLVLLLPEKDATEEAIFSQCMWLQTWFGDRAWVAAYRWMELDDELRLYALEVAAKRAGVPIVATASPLMHCTSRKPLQDTLTAVRVGRPVQECGYDLLSNAQQYLRGRAVLAQEFPHEWLAETVEVARRCTFSLEELRYEYPDEIVPPGLTPAAHLRTLTYNGAGVRFPQGIPPKVVAQIEHELAVIERLQYEPYFLTVEDIVRFARSRNILCQGRGSAANSAVCYCLGVTEVDPARMNVLFERFISEERKEPPDIDIDFEHQRREEVMQYIYRKYGRDRAALTGVVTTYRTKSALRDVGKALGFPLVIAEQLAKTAYGTDEQWISDACLAENNLDRSRQSVSQWIEIANEVRGFPRHLSQHTGGFVIARDKLSRLVPVENAAMEDRSIIQWDKDDLDVLGLLKVDCLALGMLTAIHRALDLVGLKRGSSMRMQDVPAEDPLTYQMIQKADTVGVFQIESRAQMTMLPRLQPVCFYDLVIQVAIVRPGPIQGGMVHPYLRRRAGEEAIEYPSEEIRAATERTLGIPLFQEQVMHIAMAAADFTPGEADQLRRAMGAWRKRGGLEVHQQKLIQRMLAKGYTQEFADRIAKQIEGFGSYGFPESHAASFALLVYVSCWLKRHHPDAFLTALLNSQPMGFYAPAQLVRDAREHGVVIRPVDVQVSAWDSVLEEPAKATNLSARWDTRYKEPLRAVRLGFSRIGGMRAAAAERIVAARSAGAFTSVEDLTRRAELDAHDLKCLSGADALLTLAGHRPNAVWEAVGVDTRPTRMLRDARTLEDAIGFATPDEGAEIFDDYATMGLTLRRHPLALLRHQLAGLGVLTSESLRMSAENGQKVRASGIVTHRQQPSTASGVIFATLEDETGTTNIIVWPSIAEEQRRALRGSMLLTVDGIWQSEKGVQSLVASQLTDHTNLLQGLRVSSRDFR
ncbi:error-prone DNA polymerase [Variovorax boronicumulans]|uniref:Error-prone DNA polymerase n=1 Tax=Variovorax boronicumulans TaxID=436515 RepID=A0AAW8D874_9BURK|nr:error-prone DNA polymerase [Variovorax boronicumulans]MDP9897405.1 error-prone DNA polymerase [Variovorax boronicumulans]MDQ0057453.1 error-prone DNA polymerase [Variovorax boronicumulans]